MIRPLLALIGFSAVLVATTPATSQEPPPAQWLRLDPLPGEMKLTARESFDGVPPRFVLLTDGSVFVGGRREVLRGSLDRSEMQAISTRLDLVFKSFGRDGPPKTLVMGQSPGEGDGPALFRFSVLLGATAQVVVMGKIPPAGGPPLLLLPDFIQKLAAFRHASLKPWDPSEFTMIVRERTLPGGCRTAKGLPSLTQALTGEITVPEALTRSFPTGSEMVRVCEGPKRYTVVFRPLIPGGR